MTDKACAPDRVIRVMSRKFVAHIQGDDVPIRLYACVCGMASYVAALPGLATFNKASLH